MVPLGTIFDWIGWKRSPRLDSLPFEELQNHYREDPVATYREFIRRLRPLVFHAAVHYLHSQPGDSPSAVDKKVDEVFEEFSPQFCGGDPDTLLRRFAVAIRTVLGEDSFAAIGWRFYNLLAVYHLDDPEERRFLAASNENALGIEGTSLAEDLAARLQVTADEVREVLPRANSNLQEVIRSKFSPEDLRDLTEDYLSY